MMTLLNIESSATSEVLVFGRQRSLPTLPARRVTSSSPGALQEVDCALGRAHHREGLRIAGRKGTFGDSVRRLVVQCAHLEK